MKETNINIRTSPEVKQELKQLAKDNDMSLSDYMITSSLGNKKIETKTITEITIK